MPVERRWPLGVRAGVVGCIAASLVLAACTVQEGPRNDTTTVASSRTGGRSGSVWNADAWQPPVVDSTPDDPLEVSIYRGLAIITHVRDSLPAYTASNLNCTSCHLDEGRRGNAAPLVGSYVRYPKYVERAAAVVPIEDRINYCFTRSLAGSKLPPDSREMQDIVAYLAYISKGVPAGESVKNEGMPKMPDLHGDSATGHGVFVANCARCHGNNGDGMGAFPSLWGAKSFSIGASMARQERAASFIRHNMPYDRPGVLTDQQAFDVAAYMVSMPRPDLPLKELDWPNGGAPSDVPYETKNHKAFRLPRRLIPRTNDPAAAIVGAPASVGRSR